MLIQCWNWLLTCIVDKFEANLKLWQHQHPGQHSYQCKSCYLITNLFYQCRFQYFLCNYIFPCICCTIDIFWNFVLYSELTSKTLLYHFCLRQVLFMKLNLSPPAHKYKDSLKKYFHVWVWLQIHRERKSPLLSIHGKLWTIFVTMLY